MPLRWFTKLTCGWWEVTADRIGKIAATSLRQPPKPCDAFSSRVRNVSARVKHGGELQRIELTNVDIEMVAQPETVLAIDDALERFAEEDAISAELVKLRYFAGLSVEEAGNALSLSRADAYRHWKFARAWLQCELSDSSDAET